MAKTTKKPKYHSLLPLLLKNTGASMDQMMKALKAKDTHQVQNTLVSVKQAGYQCERRLVGKGDDAVARWFAKPGRKTAKTKTPKIKAKASEPKPKTKSVKARAKAKRTPSKQSPPPQIPAAEPALENA